VQPGGGAAEMALLGDSNEVAQATQVGGHTSTLSNQT
jgi:hypothetical protein